MIHLPMLSNILGQPASLAGVLDRHTGAAFTDLCACARVLAQGKGRLVITGMGASFFAALPAAQALEAAGCHVLHADASDLLHYGQDSWRRGDVAILISRSGASVETLELAAHLTRKGIAFVAVTNVPRSPLTAKAAATLSVGAAPDEMIAVQTYTGTLLSLLLLVEQMLAPASTSLAEQVQAALPNLGQQIGDTLDASAHWQAFFSGVDPLYLLGRGSALASLGEGALLFHETAKASAIAMSSGQFRHGPVEVVSSAFRAVVLGSPAATRSLDWRLAQDLRSMGASVLWVGPAVETSSELFVPWPGKIFSALLPLFDIIPLQVAAYRLALWRDVRPGSFRYAPEITEKETGFALLQTSPAG